MSKRIITLGKWNDTPIEWIVLKEENNNALVISRLALFAMDCRNNGNTTMDWEYSVLREYLNGEFYNKAFSSIEKLQIVNAKLEDVNNAKDNVFLLSKQEAETFMTQDERKCGNGECPGNCNICYQNSNSWGTCWYLRTRRDNNYYYLTCVDGSISWTYHVRNIRPSVWIKEK